MNDLGNKTKESWSTRVGVILAVMGSAVGLGNFLRFPGKAAQYEGGAFMIPYFVSFLLLGLPIAWAEWTMGRYGGRKGFNSVPGIFRVTWKNRASPYLGALGLLIPVAIYMYYVYIEAWCLGYAVQFARGAMALGPEKDQYTSFFVQFVGLGKDGAVFESLSSNHGLLNSALFYLGICFILNFILIYRGLTKGIEWFCKWAMPALILCAVLVLIRVLTIGTPNPDLPDQNVINGLGFMWNPGSGDKTLWQSLGNAQMWLEAAGQIFFSLSVGFGIISCYASYMKKDDDVALSSVTAAAGNEFCEVALGGLITIPAAFIFLGAAESAAVAGSTFNLGFMTLPMVFTNMPLGQFVGFLFFFLLFLAAVTSSLSMLQPAIAFLEEALAISRKASVTILGLITLMGTGFIVYFSENAKALDTIDFWVGSLCVFILATIQVIMFGWGMGIDKGYKELHCGAEIKIPRFVMYIIKYVSPVFLLTIFTLWLVQQVTAKEGNYFTSLKESTVAQLSIGVIAVLLVFFLLLIVQAVKRWDSMDAELKETD